MSSSKKEMPQPDRVEASKIAVEARRARADIKEKLRSGEISHLTVLKQSLEDSRPAATLRITDFLLTLQGVGKTKVPKILDALRISEKKRLGGLGVNQRAALEKYLRDKLKISQHSNKQTLTVLAGPTAVGKGTVAAYIRKHYPEIKLSVSATTRAPRPGEQDGVHYHFMSDEEFDRTLAEGGFLEWAFVHNAYRYGTLKDSVLQAQKDGNVMLLEIDLQGARQVSVAMPDARMVFLAPPSWDELVSRLIGRGTESEEEQKRRLETAKIELASANEFDEVIVNDTVTLAAERLAKVMLG
ncbi:MAG TPA: guanylate kinase [Microbacteriaceae bacterium]|nr:guanylate kinase [Microbacteriaceae bacterium]